MSDSAFYQSLTTQALADQPLSEQVAAQILSSREIDLLPLVHAAFLVRQKYFGKEVMIHIINNVQNGYCSEDCHYCAQSRSSQSLIESYPMKPDEEILAEARRAYESGAARYCLVFSGHGQTQQGIEHLAELVKEIKRHYPIEVCVSPGILTKGQIEVLRIAGLDRLNHNLNTSSRFYPQICTTHCYADRLNTLNAAKSCGLQLCSGVIIGMGEDSQDIIEMAKTLNEYRIASIPVNFYIPLEGNLLRRPQDLTPEYCLRVLCLFRFLNPRTEIRIAAGREIYLRGMETLALYPANSLFMDGYLNVKGAGRQRTLQMIRDAGFNIKSEFSINELIAAQERSSETTEEKIILKDTAALRPAFQNKI